MNRADEPSPIGSHRSGGLSLDDRLEGIEELLREIRTHQGQVAERLAEAKAQTDTHALRLRALEIVTYGACSIGLAALLGAVITLVLRQQAAP